MYEYDQQKVVAMLFVLHSSPYIIVRDRQRNFYRLCADDTNFVGFNFGKFKKILTSEKHWGGSCPPLPPFAGATVITDSLAYVLE